MDLWTCDGTYSPACALGTLHTAFASDGCTCAGTACQAYVISAHSTKDRPNDTDDTANIFIEVQIAV